MQPRGGQPRSPRQRRGPGGHPPFLLPPAAAEPSQVAGGGGDRRGVEPTSPSWVSFRFAPGPGRAGSGGGARPVASPCPPRAPPGPRCPRAAGRHGAAVRRRGRSPPAADGGGRPEAASPQRRPGQRQPGWGKPLYPRQGPGCQKARLRHHQEPPPQ